MHRFNFLIDKYLNDPKKEDHYSNGLVKSRLAEKRKKRRSFLGQDKKPIIAAFGAKNWEKYGLWPSFERISHFYLSDYGTEYVFGSIPSQFGEERRKCHADGFLKFIDNIEKDITCAFFYASGRHISDYLIEELHDRGIWTVIMSLDDKHQFSFPVDSKTGEPHQIRVAKKCDLYWTTWKTGTQIILNLEGNPWYAPEGADPAFYHPVDVPRNLDIVFIGKNYGYRTRLMQYLKQKNFKVKAFGKGWPDGFVSFKEMIELYSRTKVVLGNGGVGYMESVKHLKARDFEVPMCGSLYLTSYNPELADHFKIGEEIQCYSSFEECADVLHWILSRPDESVRIRRAALERSLQDHTWEIRLNNLFSLFSS